MNYPPLPNKPKRLEENAHFPVNTLNDISIKAIDFQNQNNQPHFRPKKLKYLPHKIGVRREAESRNTNKKILPGLSDNKIDLTNANEL